MIVLLATAWGSSAGGINAFNFGLARGLGGQRPNGVACSVLASADQRKPSLVDGVFVVPVKSDGNDRLPTDCADEVIRGLAKLGFVGEVSHWVGHDLITGEEALAAAERHGGKAVLIHHMKYLGYQNMGGGRGDDAARNHERQIELFSRAELAFGVGARLAESARHFGAGQSHVLIPGFPEMPLIGARDDQDLCMIAAGRFDAKSESLKRINAAAAGFGRAIRIGRQLIPSLQAATITILGADPDRQTELEALAHAEAGQPVNIVPASFNSDPAAVARHLSSSNLAVIPSRHEGFGLIGWEAIGTATPLILGVDTGLAKQLATTLDVSADGLVHVIDFNGTDDDVEAITSVITKVARDIPKALRKAANLREQLKSELGCSWADTAKAFLAGLGDASPLPTSIENRRVYKPRCVTRNQFLDCVELAVSTGQGANPHSVEVVAELRFGTAELDVDGVEAEITLTRARLRVTPESGRLEGTRLGDETRPVEGLEARAGGIWLMTAPPGQRLPNKVLGDETLCRIEAAEGIAISARVEVTAAKRDLRCDVRVPNRRLKNATQKVLGVFLKNAIMDDESGHIHFSSARLGGRDDAQ